MNPKRVFMGIDGLIWGLAAVTMLFSGVYIYDILPDWLAIKWLMAGLISFLLTKAWHTLYRYKLRIHMEKEWPLWIPIVAISVTTVWGTVSTFHARVVENTLESQEYQNLQAERDLLQSRFEKQIQINYITRSEQTSREIAVIDAKMERLRKLGAGAKNSLYTTIAEHIGWSVNTIALIRLIFFAVLFDGIILLMMKISETIHDAELKQPFPTPQLNNPQKKSDKNGKDRVLTRLVGYADPRPLLDLANEKIKRNKQERMRLLAAYVEEHPTATLSEMADAIGVSSRETVRRYL